MLSTRLYAFVALVATLASTYSRELNAVINEFLDAATLIQKAQPASDPGALNLNGTETDSETIANTASEINQNGGAVTDDLPPDHPPPATSVTAVDGTITDQNNTSSRREVLPVRRRFPRRSLAKRDVDGFTQVFQGTGTGPDDRDASFQGAR